MLILLQSASGVLDGRVGSALSWGVQGGFVMIGMIIAKSEVVFKCDVLIILVLADFAAQKLNKEISKDIGEQKSFQGRFVRINAAYAHALLTYFNLKNIINLSLVVNYNFLI